MRLEDCNGKEDTPVPIANNFVAFKTPNPKQNQLQRNSPISNSKDAFKSPEVRISILAVIVSRATIYYKTGPKDCFGGTFIAFIYPQTLLLMFG